MPLSWQRLSDPCLLLLDHQDFLALAPELRLGVPPRGVGIAGGPTGLLGMVLGLLTGPPVPHSAQVVLELRTAPGIDLAV